MFFIISAAVNRIPARLIVSNITRSIADQALTIRLPVHVTEALHKVRMTSRALTMSLGREPTATEIAQNLSWEPDKVEFLLKLNADTISLDTPIGEDGDSAIGDFISDLSAEDPESAAEKAGLQRDLKYALESLTDRERQVLLLRFGFVDGREHTLEEVSAKFGVTRERIRQIEAKALRKLRHPARSKLLRGYTH